MNKKTYAKIVKAASFLVTALDIECRIYLDAPFRLAIDILEVLADGKHHKPCDIAQYLIETNSSYREKGLNPSTVYQVLQEIREGSALIASDRKKGWYFKI
ncbi:hypothetical protein CAL7716_055720 [Calothrix sp. PCC 7716]|nr:hypothetical protein CAL7716_055720 [Calothrix sp. PCC 7716]